MKYESLGVYRSTIALVFIALGIWYLNWRIPTLAHESPIFSAIVYGAEIYGFITALLHLMMTWRLTIRESLPCPEGVTVDVFVTTYNEPVDLVRKTLLAAKHMDYPHETWLIDDGNRHKMKELADRLGVRYLARLDNENAKAGNLNNALKHSGGEFVALFDADHAPQKNFLTKTLGYFQDPKVAFVQTPHEFFNLDSYQHRLLEKKRELWTEQALFFKVIQRGKDYWNAAFFCGSCAVMRRSALDKIGGFATDTITEDLHTSIRLHKEGYKSVYHAEALAYGIAPSNVAPFLKQRVRWGQGAMQVFRKEKLLFDTRLTIAQKLNYLASKLTYFDGWQKGIFYISPAVVLIAGIMPIHVEAVDFLIHFVPYYLLNFIVFEEVGRGYGGTLYIEQYNFARFAAFAWSTLGLFAGKLRFSVTSKVRERSAKTSRLFLPQLALLLVNTGAIPFGLLMSLETGYLPLEAVYFNILWAAVNCALAFMLLSFTRKVQVFLREEYRFPIPLPVVIRDGNIRVHGTIDNIAMSGCRVYAPLPYNVRRSRMLRGEIYLPSGPLPFEAQIMSEITGEADQETYIKAVGCRFIWSRVETRDALEIFLYGTDLQWKLLNINEYSSTPLQWVTKIGRVFDVQPDERWATCMLMQQGEKNPPQLGLVPLTSDGAVPRQLVTFQPLSIGAELQGLIYTRMGRIGMQLSIGECECLDNAAGTIYLYPIAQCTIRPEVKDIPIPTPGQDYSCEPSTLLVA